MECEAIGLMEQIEDGEVDHNILAVPRGETAVVDGKVRSRLTHFVLHVFEHIEGSRFE